MDDEPKEMDEELDARLEAGWRALDMGDREAARVVARAALGDPETRMDGLMLSAACARDEGDVSAALAFLAEAAKADPDWCTPELWTAELLAADPDPDSQSLGEALRHARRALDRAEEEDEFLGALACKAGIELDLGRPTEARRTLRGLPAADVSLDDAPATLEFAELLLEAGDAAEARVRLETLTATEPGLADAWYLLGVAAEVLDDEDAKRAAWVKTRALDLEQIDAPGDSHTLTEEALVAVAEETLAALPDELRGLLANVPIVVADLPALADVANGLDPRLLGLFAGTPHGERGAVSETPTLTEIVLFRRNIERVADDTELLHDEVRTTLLHEAGHFFGLDETALARLGLA